MIMSCIGFEHNACSIVLYVLYFTLRYVTLRYVTLRYVTLRYVTLRYVTLLRCTICIVIKFLYYTVQSDPTLYRTVRSYECSPARLGGEHKGRGL